MNFGQALEFAKAGEKIARAGWNSKGMFVYFVEGSTVFAQELRGTAARLVGDSLAPTALVTINGHFDMKAADDSIVVGWNASQVDLQATDWVVV